MTSTANLASAEADADHPATAAAEAESFVLNLCSSTTPMALAQTDLPELKRFTFFVSRRFEEGRERFRLHMGFFASLAEAEEWLGLVRDLYPGAWAGEAPGKKLRARAAEAAAAQARHAVGPQKTVAPAAAPVPTPAAPPVARLASAPAAAPPKIPTLVPTLHPPAAAPASARAPVPAAGAARALPAQAPKAAPPQLAKRPAATPPAPRVAAAPAVTQRPAAARPAPAARPAAASALPPQSRAAAPSTGAQRPVAKAAPGRPAAPTGAVAPAAHAKPAAAPAMKSAPTVAARSSQPAARAAQQPAKKPTFANSNVKEVLAALDTPDATGETRVMPAVSLSFGDATDDASLTDTQVLRFLETRRAADGVARPPAGPQADPAAESGISLLKPDDTGTRRALKEAVTQNEPVAFAVQLQWSVQPVQLDQVPPLAIFSAYTLYSVEGSREGRKWYGLRLGFFSDAISAKQVAYYVRSEFTSVAVVPVSPEERVRATEDNQRFSGVGAPRKRRHDEDHGIKLIDSNDAPGGAPAAAAAPAASAASRTPAAPQPAAARNARKGGGGSGGQVGARERRTPQTLEETLEILGANELAIDNGGGDSLSDTGVRHLRVEVQKNTPFSRLLERLSERVKKA
jgi:hypothetical protein